MEDQDVVCAHLSKKIRAAIKTKLEEIMDAVNASPPRLALPDKPTSIQAQSVIDKYEEIGYKVVKTVKKF